MNEVSTPTASTRLLLTILVRCQEDSDEEVSRNYLPHLGASLNQRPPCYGLWLVGSTRTSRQDLDLDLRVIIKVGSAAAAAAPPPSHLLTSTPTSLRLHSSSPSRRASSQFLLVPVSTSTPSVFLHLVYFLRLLLPFVHSDCSDSLPTAPPPPSNRTH